jgi:endonuclease I
MSNLSSFSVLRFFSTLCLLSFVWVNTVSSQLFPGLEGEELVDSLRTEYTPIHLLNDTQVKDTLYGKIFIEGDSVRCIYSGLAHYLPQGVDPSQWVYGNGNEIISINLEHGWPQAKGAGDGTNGNMDMNHLYPSRVAINSDRGDYPYADISDNSTQTWYYLGQEMSNVPSSNIDAYSEFVPGFFEPRESVKGDIARAMFYFWTIYRADAVAADPDYFEMMRASICQWHDEDPVDDFEAVRNNRIAFYQGKQNPFIIDCSLVKRTYCPANPDCGNVSVVNHNEVSSFIQFDVDQSRFRIQSEDNLTWTLTIVNLLGQILYTEEVNSGQWSQPNQFATGIYLVYGLSGKVKVTGKFFLR